MAAPRRVMGALRRAAWPAVLVSSSMACDGDFLIVDDFGQGHAVIVGRVENEAGEDVENVRVDLRVRDEACDPPDEASATFLTDQDGAFARRVIVPSSLAGKEGCVRLAFTPPALSGLDTLSVDSLSVFFEDTQLDPDTVRVDVMLPDLGIGGL